ncbi:hypothetical protein PVK06_045198 [Gossypium arboreum]|uniref:DUF4005 domain-containing protein n=1 Tax=Gossypium arboreum TaxID=29729 RepID=A0ABR0MTF5_GOSAR|nr:hypothetical protein PVK06_045198 [Gossypium arboreum]
MTLRCMQVLVKVQSRVLDQRMRLSRDGCSRKSAFSDTNSVWESWYLLDISDRRSLSREGSSIADEWDERPHTVEEVKAMLRRRKEAALKHEKSLSQALSQQMRRARRSPSIGGQDEWLDRWMPAKPWDNRGRASIDQRDNVKTVEMDTSQPYSYLAPNYRRTNSNHDHQRPSSPLHRAQLNAQPFYPSPITPSPSKKRLSQVRSASPRYVREDRTPFSSSQTPSLRSNYYYTGKVSTQASTSINNATPLPNYMAAQRPQSLGLEPYGIEMRYEVYGHSLRSLSFKSVNGLQIGLEQQSNYSSCCTESLGGEMSPSSTSDLRRWLK